MLISTYRIPVKPVYNQNDEQENFAEILKKCFRHLYLAANMTYQHYYQLLQTGDQQLKNIYTEFIDFQKSDTEAWETLNTYKLKYCSQSTQEDERKKIAERINNLPDEIYTKRNHAKRKVYDFIETNDFIHSLKHKFENKIPATVVEYSMTKVLQELFIDFDDVKEKKQPSRVYSKFFPASFGWNGLLNKSFEHEADIPFIIKQPEAKEQRYAKKYLYKWQGDENFSFHCRVGKNLPELAEVLNKIISGEITFHNIGDPSLQPAGDNEYIFQFIHKKDINKALPTIEPGKPMISMGVDLGYTVPLAWAITDDTFTSGELPEMENDIPAKNIIKNERKEIIHEYELQVAAMKQSRSGQGRARKSAVLKKRATEERIYFQQKNAEWAHKLVEKAKQHNVNIIKIEDLDFKEKKDELKRKAKEINLKLAQRGETKRYKSFPDNLLTMYRHWSYGHLLACIEKEATENSILVARVHPAKTSMKCHKCNEEGNRKKQAYLQFTAEQRGKCNYKEQCILIPYTLKELQRKRRNTTKNRYTESFTHYLLADHNAAKRIAVAQQYHTQKDKK